MRGIRICKQTIRNRLHNHGLHARRLVKRALLTARHREARLNWARQHVRWTRRQWSSVLFTDEVRICLRHTDGRRRVWRRRGEAHAEVCVQPVVFYGGGSVMAWAGISTNGKTDLIIIDGNLNAQRYRDEILEPTVIPYAGAVGPETFILMDDNARPHRGRVVNDFIEEQGIERMVWPAASPDLNPLEHLWDHLKRQIYTRILHDSTLRDLRRIMVEVFAQIPQRRVRRLINSMSRRCRNVIDNRGGYTRY